MCGKRSYLCFPIQSILISTEPPFDSRMQAAKQDQSMSPKRGPRFGYGFYFRSKMQ
jgi:hypothetical protein